MRQVSIHVQGCYSEKKVGMVIRLKPRLECREKKIQRMLSMELRFLLYENYLELTMPWTTGPNDKMTKNGKNLLFQNEIPQMIPLGNSSMVIEEGF